jgi:ATP-binding cassette subfamily B protein
MKKSHMTRTDAAADSKVIAFLSDAITNMVTIKTFARTRLEAKNFKEISSDRYKKRYRSWRFNSHIRDIRWVVALSFYITYILLSIHLVAQGSITPAAMVAGQIYVFVIFGSLLTLHIVVQRTEQLFADAAELTDILYLEPELKDPENPEKIKINKGLIEFNSVEFKYPNTSKNVFKGLDLEIQSGQRVGLVGHSGSGKSTITRLVLRFFDIKDGKILIDGQNITHITQDDLRRNIAYIPQEPILFHRSIKDNIAYGREDATDEEIYEACRLAYADDFIQYLPNKYDTLVGERGVKLSGGEKQRVAIARAMLTRAPILILDEATSALDSKSEKYITKALDKLMNGRTTIVIAHRLSTIRKLDRIIVLKNGEVIENGTHKELLELGGEYSELWSHQTGNFLDSE